MFRYNSSSQMWGQLIVRPKAVESKKDTFCYLSSYLHCSFFCYFVIIISIILSGCQAKAKTLVILKTSSCIKNVGLYQERLLVLSSHLIIRKPLSCYREVSRIVVVPFLLLYFYLNAVYQCHLINSFEVWAAQNVISSSWWITHLHLIIYQDLFA